MEADAINGVSRLHGEVSRRIFQPLFPRWPQDEVPIAHVTNGVHVPTWDSAEADRIWTEACGTGSLASATLENRGASTCAKSAIANSGSLRAADAQSLVEYAEGNVFQASWRVMGASRLKSKKPDRIFGSEHFDDGICAPLRHLQAAELAFARSRAADPHSDQQSIGRCN